MPVPIRPEDLTAIPSGIVSTTSALIVDDGAGVWKATPRQVAVPALAANDSAELIGTASGDNLQEVLDALEAAIGTGAGSIGLFDDLSTPTIAAPIIGVQTDGFYVSGVGRAFYIYDAAVDATYVTDFPLSSFLSADGRGWRLDISNGINLFQVGATGVASQTLLATSYATDRVDQAVTITQQTIDGLAINEALRILRAAGAGKIIVPAGHFSTYAYLERLNFDLEIEGFGQDVSVIESCLLSPSTNGYGIFCITPTSLASITLKGVTIDGRHEEVGRTAPSGEKRVHNIAVYGYPRLTLDHVTSVNSGCDCIVTAYESGDIGTYVRATDCIFSNSFRMSVTCAHGWNQSYTSCIIEKGGSVGAGISPKLCIDVEPDDSADTIKRISFNNCIIREGVSGLIAFIWAQIEFNGCVMVSNGGLPVIILDNGASQVSLNNCRHVVEDGDYGRYIQSIVEPTGEYSDTAFLNITDFDSDGVGIKAFGRTLRITGVMRNALHPIYLAGSGTQNSVMIRGLDLINVFDADNVGGGTYASYARVAAYEGKVDALGLWAWVDPLLKPADMDVSGITQAMGIYAAAANANHADKYHDVGAEGFYKRAPAMCGQAENAANFRDWAEPNTVPADTASGTLTKGANHYRDCTMLGDVT